MKNNLISALILFVSVGIMNACPDTNFLSIGGVEKNIKDFDGVATSNGIDVILTMGNVEKIVVETTDKTMPYVILKKEKSTLVIKLDDKAGYRNKDNVKVYITAKTIVKLSASGGADIKVTNSINTKDLDIAISGGGSFDGAIKTTNLNLAQSGGSDANLTGTTQNLNFASSGGSTTKNYGFIVNKLECSMSGGGNIYVTVDGIISASVSGGSNIYYKGKGRVENQKLSGGSEIFHK